MINREITYERDVNKSYMKISATIESGMDEKLMFRKAYHGILPMEKCYVNGHGQYWYNISGKQDLDAYCRVNSIDKVFFEKLILRICSQLEILEWNLIDTNCLVIDPEFIFLNHSGEDVVFMLYPNPKENFGDELRHLMEYLLTKLNHGDKGGVHEAYQIYDIVLKEGYSMSDLKQMILSRRTVEEFVKKEEIAYSPKEETYKESKIAEVSEADGDMFQEIEKKIRELVEKVKEILWTKKENKEEVPVVVYPEDNYEEEQLETINPTICIASTLGVVKGVLMYEGNGDYPNIELNKETIVIGKSEKAKLHINRETVSQFHAKIEYMDKTYYIEDMNSTNGTFVNEKMLNYKEKKALCTGDLIVFADVKYRFL